jgi:hypothetical protein
MTDFRDWTRPQDALAKIAERIEDDLGTAAPPSVAGVVPASSATVSGTGALAYLANYLYAERGDNWQDGRTWPIDYGDLRVSQLAKVRPMFCGIGMIVDGIGRQNDALFKREPTISFEPLAPAGKDGKPSEAQAREAREYRDRFSNWWDAVGLWGKVRSAGARAAWGRRGPLRTRFLPRAFAVPPGADADADRQLATWLNLSGEEALALVALEDLLPNDGLVYTDPESQERACIIRISEKTGTGAGTEREAAEVWYMDTDATGADVAVRRTLHADGASVTEHRLPGGTLPLHEITGELLVTPSVRQQQAQVDYGNTKLTRAMQTAGDRERYTVDAEDPGVWSLIPTGPGIPVRTTTDNDGNTLYFHPGVFEAGPEIWGMVQSRVVPGATDADPDQVAKASVVLANPVDPAYLSNARDSAIAVLRREMKQGHVGAADSNVSAEKVKQDRADFGNRCDSYKQSAELAIAGVLTSAGVNASLLTAPGDWLRGVFANYRIVCTLHIDTGPLTAEETSEIVELGEKGIIPRADVMARAGRVEDFAIAEGQIAADPVQRIARRAQVLDEAIKIKDGFSAQAAIAALRESNLFSNAELAAMERNDFTGLEQ